MSHRHKWTFLILGSILALLLVAAGIMVTVLMDGWKRTGGIFPIYWGWVIFRYCRGKYG